MEYNPKDKTIIFISLAICLLTFVSAYCSVCISQIVFLIQLKNNLKTEQLIYQLTLTTSAFNLGSIVGPLLKKRIINAFQSYRRPLLFFNFMAIFCLSFQLIQLDYRILATSRLFLGIFIGVSLAIVPVYLKQLVPKQIAGKIGTFNQLLQTIGVLICYLVGFLLIQLGSQDQIVWRIFMGFPIFVLIFQFILIGFIFPYDGINYQLEHNKSQLLSFLAKLYKNAEDAMNQLSQEARETKKEAITLKQSKIHSHKLIISLVLMISNQATGINFIIFYTKQVFEKMRAQSAQNLEQKFLNQQLMCILALFQVGSAFLSTFTIEAFGRKKIILFGQSLIIFLLLCISFSIQTGLVGLSIFLIFIHIVVHNWSLGSVCIIYSADLLTDLTYVIAALKVCSFSVALSSGYLLQYIGISKIFIVYALISSFCYLYLNSRLKETKGLSKPQINELFSKDLLLKQL